MRGLYAITPAVADTRRLCAMCAAALEGGAAILQYRNPDADDNKRREQAAALAALCRAFGVFFIVNDSPALAAETGADGVHLGRGDMDLLSAREVAGADAIVGATCGDSPARAEQAMSAGANYCALGAVFPSPTKPSAPACALEKIAEAKRRSGLPVAAVGGIHIGNIAQVAKAGADMAAVVSALFTADDIRKTARELSAAFLDASMENQGN